MNLVARYSLDVASVEVDGGPNAEPAEMKM